MYACMYMSVGMYVLSVIELQGAGVLAPLAIFVAPVVNCEFLEVQGCKTYHKKWPSCTPKTALHEKQINIYKYNIR